MSRVELRRHLSQKVARWDSQYISRDLIVSEILGQSYLAIGLDKEFSLRRPYHAIMLSARKMDEFRLSNEDDLWF